MRSTHLRHQYITRHVIGQLFITLAILDILRNKNSPSITNSIVGEIAQSRLPTEFTEQMLVFDLSLRYAVVGIKRVIAIGDIDGHSPAVNSLIDWIRPDRRDTLVFPGNCVSRGPDSSGTVERIIRLTEYCSVVSLKGNHE